MNLVQGLIELDELDVHVATFVGKADQARDESRDGFALHYLYAPLRLTNLTLHVVQRHALKRLLARVRPHVVHAQDAMSYGYVCLKAADDVPVVVSIHGIVREELRLANTRLTLQAALAGVPLQRYCLRHARYLTQPTTYPARYFGNAIQGTIVDVGNAVSNEFFSVTPTPEAGRVLYVGGVFERKRVLELVEAIARVRPSVPNVSLHICGEERSGAYAEKVRQRVRELQLENAVTFLGGVSASQLVTEYSRAAVFALASGRETSPISIVEAMAVGVPVLATEVGGIPELIRDGGGIVVPLNDRDAFDEGLVELLTHDERRRSCSEAGRARANLFRRDVVAERVRDLYEAATTRL